MDADTIPDEVDEADLDEMPFEKAVGLSLLAECSAIRAELQGIRAALEGEVGAETGTDEGDSEPDGRYRCCGCGEVAPDEEAAKAHAVNEHNCPPEDNAWRVSMEAL